MAWVRPYKAKKKKIKSGSSHCASEVRRWTSTQEDAGLIPGLIQWVKDLALPWAVCRPQTWLGLVLLWLWCRLAAAALMRHLAWELPNAAGVALKKSTPPPKKKQSHHLPIRILIRFEFLQCSWILLFYWLSYSWNISFSACTLKEFQTYKIVVRILQWTYLPFS